MEHGELTVAANTRADYNLVSSTEIEEFRASPEAQRLARLEADQEILLRLSNEGFAGATWEALAFALVEYGYAVMIAWIVTGTVFVKIRERGLAGATLARPRDGIPHAEAEELARDTVAEAIINFRDRVLKTGRWDPALGASLATFFIGNCLLRFPNVYRHWYRIWETARLHSPLEDHESRPGRSDPEAQVLGAMSASEAFRALDPRMQAIVFLEILGYSLKEAAHLTGASYKSVESRRRRARQQLRAGGSAR
jgi:DNA-directed RNA polymerase specialized sigma24 family protein